MITCLNPHRSLNGLTVLKLVLNEICLSRRDQSSVSSTTEPHRKQAVPLKQLILYKNSQINISIREFYSSILSHRNKVPVEYVANSEPGKNFFNDAIQTSLGIRIAAVEGIISRPNQSSNLYLSL